MLLNLPWWEKESERIAYYTKSVRWACNVWHVGGSRLLIERIEEEPLTRDLILGFLEGCVEDVQKIDRDDAYMFYSNQPLKFCIKIGFRSSIYERGVSLVHESIHGIYRLATKLFDTREYEDGTLTDAGVLEDTVEEEATRFYEENKTFVNCLLFRYGLTEPEEFGQLSLDFNLNKEKYADSG